jgi:hypothetical protein
MSFGSKPVLAITIAVLLGGCGASDPASSEEPIIATPATEPP